MVIMVDHVVVSHTRGPIKACSMLLALITATMQNLTIDQSRFDDDTAFSKHIHGNMVFTPTRYFILFPNVPLEFVKAIKRQANVSFNDVLMAAVSQAIHEYCIHEKDPLLVEGEKKNKNIQCRALLPCGFAPSAANLADPATALRNQWAFLSCDMAVGCSTVVDRLEQLHRNTMELKTQPYAYTSLALMNRLVKWLPKAAAQQSALNIFSRHSLVFGNLPGPSQPCALAGNTVDDIQIFHNNLVSHVNLASYGGRTISGNIIYDNAAMPHLAKHGFGASYARALVHLAQHYKVPVPAKLASI